MEIIKKVTYSTKSIAVQTSTRDVIRRVVNVKIAIRGGHNFQAPGASGIIDETSEDRKVKAAVIKYLTQEGQEVIDVTPGECDVNTDLEYGVNKANSF